MNSQHTTIAVFARRSLITRPSDIAPRRIKIFDELIYSRDLPPDNRIPICSSPTNLILIHHNDDDVCPKH